MKTFSTICISLLIAFAASCKSPKSASQIPKEAPHLSAPPIVIQDAVRNQDHKEVTLTFTEQLKYDPSLLEITAKFFKSTTKGLVPFEEQDMPSIKWLTKEMGSTGSGTPQLNFSNLKDFTRLTVSVIYDSKEIESKTFDF
jgi:hypothetical protein